MLGVAASVSTSPHAPRRAPALVGVLGLAVVVALALVVDLGRADFWDPGESRYVETVREMMATGSWLRPTLNFTHYYDKPPGYFWLVATAFGTFGRHEWAARLTSVLPAIMTIALLVAFAWRRVGPRPALGAGAVLATAIQFVVLARSVRMDMLLTLLLTGTLLAAFALWDDGGDAATDALAWPVYLLPALGVVIKGPVAVLLPVMVLLPFVFVMRGTGRGRRLWPGRSAVVAFAFVAGWYLVEGWWAPDYLWTFLWQHNVGRFVGRSLAGHPEPIWYFCWTLPVTFLPWTLFLPGALRYAFRRARRHRALDVLLVLWCAVPFVFFSISRAKLAPYLLPIFPPLALLVARYLAAVLRAPVASQARALRIPTVLLTVALAGIGVGTPVAVVAHHRAYLMPALSALLLLAFVPLGWRAVRGGRWTTVPALVLTAALAIEVLFYHFGAPVVNEMSGLRAAAEIARDLPPSASVYAYKTRGHSFTFYSERTVARLRSPAAAAEALDRREPTAVLIKKRHLEKLRAHLHQPVCIWWRGPSGCVLLANVARREAGGDATLQPTNGATSGSGDDRQPPRC